MEKKTVADWLEDIYTVVGELRNSINIPEAINALFSIMKPVIEVCKLQQEKIEEQEDQIKGLWKRILDSGH